MCKGCRLMISWSEWFLWDYYKFSDCYMDGKVVVEMEFMEEDVWLVMEVYE